jgi:hypothetical protein
VRAPLGRLLALALPALLALGGCATGSVPVVVEPHLAWEIPSDAPRSSAPRLGVAELQDSRSAAARVGARPPLELRFLGVERQGMERTGDDAFDLPVPEAVRDDVVATLARAGTFRSVELVAFDPRTASAWPAAGAPDYVLVGEIEEFAGSQWHSFVVTPFRVGFVRDRWGAPEGRVSIQFELWARGGRVWRGRVATRQESAQGGLGDAVLEALALNDEALAARLDRELRTRSRAPRLLEVRVLDGCSLGADGVRRLLTETSAIFTRESDVALIARPEPWSVPADARDLDALLDAARQVDPPAGGIVLALAPAEGARDFSLGTQRTGLAVPLGAHAVALCPEDGKASVLTAAHELAHLFGAVHVREPASIMNATADFDARFFDPLNRRILNELRERDFSRPLDPAESARLSAIYRGAERTPARVDPADLDSALRALDGRSP